MAAEPLPGADPFSPEEQVQVQENLDDIMATRRMVAADERVAHTAEVEARKAEALAAYGERSPKEIPHDRLWGAVWALVLAILAGGTVMGWALYSIIVSQDSNREVGIKNRAVACLLLEATGTPTPPSCREPDVLRTMGRE